jgi:hypothetical protein
MLTSGGIFVFTVMDGAKVFRLLGDAPSWQCVENDMVKYKISKLYKTNTLANVGQEISILLPMAAGEKSEPLCNLDYVTDQANKLGLMLVSRRSFWDYAANVGSGAKYIIDNLTPDDITYIKLYSCVVLRKK